MSFISDIILGESLGYGPILMGTNAKYEKSLYSHYIVTHDPMDEQLSFSRIIFASLMLTVSVIYQFWLYNEYNINSKGHKYKLVRFKKYTISKKLYRQMLVKSCWIALILSTIHFIDNIMRPVSYYMPYWIHAGIFISEDITMITFIVNTIIAMAGLYILLYHNFFYSNKYVFLLGIFILLYWIINLLIVFLHFYVSPIYNFSFIPLITIFGEGFGGLYVLYHLYIITLIFYIGRNKAKTQCINKIILNRQNFRN